MWRMNITGNMKDLWSNIGEMGNDVNKSSSWLTPSVVFKSVDFRGI
jgi:PmbA protein